MSRLPTETWKDQSVAPLLNLRPLTQSKNNTNSFTGECNKIGIRPFQGQCSADKRLSGDPMHEVIIDHLIPSKMPCIIVVVLVVPVSTSIIPWKSFVE